MDTAITQAIARFRAALGELGIHTDTVVVFGSHARGTPTEHSDIDVAVVSDDFEGMNLFQRLEVIGLALGRARIVEPIEALGYTRQEYEATQPGTFLGDEIKSKGVQVP